MTASLVNSTCSLVSCGSAVRLQDYRSCRRSHLRQTLRGFGKLSKIKAPQEKLPTAHLYQTQSKGEKKSYFLFSKKYNLIKKVFNSKTCLSSINPELSDSIAEKTSLALICNTLESHNQRKPFVRKVLHNGTKQLFSFWMLCFEELQQLKECVSFWCCQPDFPLLKGSNLLTS